MKRLLSLLLAALLLCASVPSAFAASEEAERTADILHALGLFQGTGTDAAGKPVYELDRVMKRTEGVTMLVRLLGKESEAKSSDWETAFTDVPDWAAPYTGCAFAYGLTKGTNAEGTQFGSELDVNAAQYLTFVLRALGYRSEEDFAWDAPWALTDTLGITAGEYGPSTAFTRGDAAVISLRALNAICADNSCTLGEKLMREGVFTEAQYREAIEPKAGEDGEYAAAAVYEKMIALQSDYPEGMPWTNDDEYVLSYVEIRDGRPVNVRFTGRGCVAFAFILSSAAFGDLPLKTLERGSFTYDDIRVGDMPRINSDTHTVIILEKYDDHVVIAEGNYNSSIHWGRTLTREQIMNSDYIWTRYPD